MDEFESKFQNAKISALKEFYGKEKPGFEDGGRVAFGNGGGNFAAIERKKEKEVLLKKLIEDANKQDKYFTQKSIAEKAGIKTPSHYTETFRTNKLMTATEKMDRVLIDLLSDDKPLNNRFVNIIRERVGGFNSRQTMKFIKETPTFKTIASQGGNFLINTTNMTNLKNLNLGQQLKRAVDIQIGQPTYIGTSGIKNRFYSPASVAMENARKSWNQNQGKGDIKFFDSKGKPIKWEYGVKLPIQEVSFKYKNKTHKYGDLVDSTYMKKYFPELQETVTNANKFKASKVDNPFIPGEKITVRDLTKEISKRGYKNNPKWGTIDILHGPNGVKGEPFTNLRYNTSDINQMELAFSNSLKAGNLNQAQYDQSIKNLNSSFEGLTGADNEKAIVQRLTTQGEKINKGTFYGFEELKKKNLSDILTDEVDKLPKNIQAKICNSLSNGGLPGNCADAIKRDPIKTSRTVIRETKSLKTAVGARALSAGRKLLKFGVLGEAAFVGGDTGVRAYMGRPKNEAFLAATFREGKADDLRKKRAGFTPREFLVDKATNLSNKISSLQQQIITSEAEGTNTGTLENSLKETMAELQKPFDKTGTRLIDLLETSSATNISYRQKMDNIMDSDRAKSMLTEGTAKDVDRGIPNISDEIEIDAGVSKKTFAPRETLPNDDDYFRAYFQQIIPGMGEPRYKDIMENIVTPMDKFRIKSQDPRFDEQNYGTQGKFANGGIVGLLKKWKTQP